MGHLAVFNLVPYKQLLMNKITLIGCSWYLPLLLCFVVGPKGPGMKNRSGFKEYVLNQ